MLSRKIILKLIQQLLLQYDKVAVIKIHEMIGDDVNFILKKKTVLLQIQMKLRLKYILYCSMKSCVVECVSNRLRFITDLFLERQKIIHYAILELRQPTHKNCSL